MRKLKQLRTLEAALAKHGLGPVVGVDEAGRGACAGPISIAACVLPDRAISDLDALDDSKKLTAKKRAELYPLVKKHALAWNVLFISAADIDAFGIQHANVSGMRRVVAALDLRPGFVLIDALKVPGFTAPSLPIIGGDAAARCIAAASVLAKQARDELMAQLDSRYPEYGFAAHKGYGTARHLDAVRRHGGCPEHRYSYSNVAAAHTEWKQNCV